MSGKKNDDVKIDWESANPQYHRIDWSLVLNNLRCCQKCQSFKLLSCFQKDLNICQSCKVPNYKKKVIRKPIPIQVSPEVLEQSFNSEKTLLRLKFRLQ